MNRRRQVDRVPLLIWAAALAALMVGAIVAATQIDTGWAVALACLGLVATAVAMAVVTRSFLADLQDEDPQAPSAFARWPALALGAVAAAAIAIAFFGTRQDEVAAATSSATSVTAARTVRQFLVAAYVDGDGEAACSYLSQQEQRQAAVAGQSTTCRDALNHPAGPPELAALTSPRQVRDLPAHVQLAGGDATIRAGGRVFLLRPATAAERAQYNAAPGYWRISSGVTSLLRAG
jgi:hypothetical protein